MGADPFLAVIVCTIFGGAYGGIYILIKRKQRALGIERVRANRERFKVSGEAFAGIKDVKVLQREESFVRQFKPASWTFSRATASNAVVTQLPRYLIETIAFGGIVAIVLYYLQRGSGISEILPLISLYAFAGYRLMPELQKLFGNVAQVRFNRAAVDDLLADYHEVPETPPPSEEQMLPFERSVRFEDVSFRYPGASTMALSSVEIEIESRQRVGLVGASGAGKTTLVDVLLGLFQPREGRILVDGATLNKENLAAWRRQVGYVPQQIFLTDNSIAGNIALGVRDAHVDHASVERAARIAHLHEFIMTLPEGYDTVVGERGVRLSGGQRQRIGIARALYHDPSLLILDEATSALDGSTENAVMQAIHELTGKKTIVIIAHRLSTVRSCDVIYLLDRGTVVQCGTYESLMKGSRSFRTFAGLGELNTPGDG